MTNTTQNLNDIESLNFDKDDQQLFYIDDLRLKADALRHSVLPKLQLMTNHAISKIDEIYGLDVFEDSHISKAPSFRRKRDNDLKLDYNYAYCGLEGKRIKNKWHGAKKPNGKEVQILPYKFAFIIKDSGLKAAMWTQPIKLSEETQHKFLNYINDNSEILSRFCFFSNFNMDFQFYLSTISENIDWMKENKEYYHAYNTSYLTYPISSIDIKNLVKNYSVFYYIYNRYLEIAKGDDSYKQVWEKLISWIQSDQQDKLKKPDKINLSKVKEAAAQKIKVMPAMRWQVFQRDDWKCVSCGRSSHDNVILNMDHITPRSKGGPDTLDNLQTLCWECNIGKSNRDDTDLRKN